jgi:hypothetical protein
MRTLRRLTQPRTLMILSYKGQQGRTLCPRLDGLHQAKPSAAASLFNGHQLWSEGKISCAEFGKEMTSTIRQTLYQTLY